MLQMIAVFSIPVAIIVICLWRLRVLCRREREAKQAKARVSEEQRAEAIEKAKAKAEMQKINAAARAQLAEAKHQERLRRMDEVHQKRIQQKQELAALDTPKEKAPAEKNAAIRPENDSSPEGRTFAGETVAFTGRLPGMTRAEAIKAVQENGGRAFEDMSITTTILVVGERPGMTKLDKADRWIGQVRKITAAQFLKMLEQPTQESKAADDLSALLASLPPTYSPDEFAAKYAA